MADIRDGLEKAIIDARCKMLKAWDEQSQTTAEEGATYDQARAAIKAAKAAQARYYELLNAHDALLNGKVWNPMVITDPEDDGVER